MSSSVTVIETPKECKPKEREMLLQHFNSSWKYPVTVTFKEDGCISLKGADGSTALLKKE